MTFLLTTVAQTATSGRRIEINRANRRKHLRGFPFVRSTSLFYASLFVFKHWQVDYSVINEKIFKEFYCLSSLFVELCGTSNVYRWKSIGSSVHPQRLCCGSSPESPKMIDLEIDWHNGVKQDDWTAWISWQLNTPHSQSLLNAGDRKTAAT